MLPVASLVPFIKPIALRDNRGKRISKSEFSNFKIGSVFPKVGPYNPKLQALPLYNISIDRFTPLNHSISKQTKRRQITDDAPK